jgi:hypothetical protein
MKVQWQTYLLSAQFVFTSVNNDVFFTSECDNSRPFLFVLRALRSSPWAVSTLTLTRGIVVQKTAKVTVNEPDNFTVYKILKNFKRSSNYPDELVGIDEDKQVYFLY